MTALSQLVAQATDSSEAMPRELVAHLAAEARTTNRPGLVSQLARHDPEATAALVADGIITAAERARLLTDTRVTVCTALAADPQLSAGQMRQLADAGQPAVAWQLLDRDDLPDDVEQAAVATLADAYRDGRARNPSATQIAGHLPYDHRDALLACDQIPAGLLPGLAISVHDDAATAQTLVNHLTAALTGPPIVPMLGPVDSCQVWHRVDVRPRQG